MERKQEPQTPKPEPRRGKRPVGAHPLVPPGAVRGMSPEAARKIAEGPPNQMTT